MSTWNLSHAEHAATAAKVGTDKAACPICRATVAVRQSGELRHHPDHRHHMYGVPGAVRSGLVPTCAGSGTRSSTKSET